MVPAAGWAVSIAQAATARTTTRAQWGPSQTLTDDERWFLKTLKDSYRPLLATRTQGQTEMYCIWVEPRPRHGGFRPSPHWGQVLGQGRSPGRQFDDLSCRSGGMRTTYRSTIGAPMGPVASGHSSCTSCGWLQVKSSEHYTRSTDGYVEGRLELAEVSELVWPRLVRRTFALSTTCQIPLPDCRPGIPCGDDSACQEGLFKAVDSELVRVCRV